MSACLWIETGFRTKRTKVGDISAKYRKAHRFTLLVGMEQDMLAKGLIETCNIAKGNW